MYTYMVYDESSMYSYTVVRSRAVGGTVNFTTSFLMKSLKGLKHVEDTL